jgi:hypothetical protein
MVPILEDCILNGRLRTLEVWVRDQGYLRRNDGIMGHGGREGEEYENWRVLRRVCADPYLERVVLKAGALVLTDGEVVHQWTQCEDVPLI